MESIVLWHAVILVTGNNASMLANGSNEDCNKFTGCVMREMHENDVYTSGIVNHEFLNSSQLTVYICTYMSNSPSTSVKHTLNSYKL